MPTQTAATRSVVVGLLLAALSAGSLIAFSLFAGEADNPTETSVVAARPDGDVTEVVLGKRVTRGPVPVPVVPAGSSTAVRPGPPGESLTVADIVLGTRLKNGEATDGKNAKDQSSPGDGDNRKHEGNGKNKGKGKNKNDKGNAKSSDEPSTARATSACRCKARGDHSPNGHAYGYHKSPSSSDSRGLARGHSKGHASSHGKAKAKK